MHPQRHPGRSPHPGTARGTATALAAVGAALPAWHTAAELAALLTLLPADARTVTLGHSRDDPSRAAVAAFRSAWEDTGRSVLKVVDWPEDAASWLRQAQRFTEGAPDVWVVAARPAGWAGMSRRLRHSTDWRPDRTCTFASLADPGLPDAAGVDALDGLRGAAADGGTWQFQGEELVTLRRPT